MSSVEHWQSASFRFIPHPAHKPLQSAWHSTYIGADMINSSRRYGPRSILRWLGSIRRVSSSSSSNNSDGAKIIVIPASTVRSTGSRTATTSLGNGAREPTAQDDLTRDGPRSRQDHVEGLLKYECASLEGMLIRLEESLYLQRSLPLQVSQVDSEHRKKTYPNPTGESTREKPLSTVLPQQPSNARGARRRRRSRPRHSRRNRTREWRSSPSIPRRVAGPSLRRLQPDPLRR